VLLSLIDREDGATCSAEPVSVETKHESPTFAPGEEACDLKVGGLIQRIKEEESRLAEKALRLEETERRLQIYSREVVEKINNLETLRLAVEKIHKQIIQNEDETQQRLVKIYDAMEPENAALRLEAMDDALGSWLLLRINVRKAGQILGALSPEKASRITTRLRGEDPRSARQIEEALRSSRQKTASGEKKEATAGAKPKRVTQKHDVKERFLQIGTFSEPKRAEILVQELMKKGYPSFHKEWTLGTPLKTYYKVFVGPFPDAKLASETKARLEKKEGYKGILMRSPAAAGV
jgi:flagellar motility protein MotE (MotC chaperone)